MVERDREHVIGKTGRTVAGHDVRRRAHRQPNFGGSALTQIMGDLHARGPRTDDEYSLAGVGRRIAVSTRVRQLTGEAAGPVRYDRSVQVAGGNDDLSSLDLAVGGAHQPSRCPAVDSLDVGIDPQLDTPLAGVPCEVLDDLVTARIDRSALGI